MRQIRISKRHRLAAELDPLPLDPRDPDIVRAKERARRQSRTGEGRARPTATEPTTRCVAGDELPTMIATFSSGWASPMALAAAIS